MIILCSYVLIIFSGSADIPDSENVRKLIQCLREVRHQKTLDGLKLIDGDPLKVIKSRNKEEVFNDLL